MPYDGERYFPRKAIEDLQEQLGKSSDARSNDSDEASALVGHLALTNIKMAKLEDGSPLGTRHGAIPLRLPVRSSTLDDEVLTFDEQEAVRRTDYVPDVLEDYPLPLRVKAEVFDPEDGMRQSGSADEIRMRRIVSQPAFSSELRLRFQIFLLWPRRRGKLLPDVRIKRVSLKWPTLTSLEPNSLRFTIGRLPHENHYEMHYNPEKSSLEWVGIPIGEEPDDEPDESGDAADTEDVQDAGDANSAEDGDDAQDQPPAPKEDGEQTGESTGKGLDDSTADGEQTDDEDASEGDDDEVWDLRSPPMNLLVRQPGQLRHQDHLEGTVEIEVVDELLSGIEARLFDATGRRPRSVRVSVRTKLRMDFRLVLDDEFNKRRMSATHTIHFDEVVPDPQRVHDITAVLRDRGFNITRHARDPGEEQQLPWLIRAERREGPDEIRLDIVVTGQHYRTERRFKTPGWHDYTTELGSGELRLTVFGQVPRSSRELTTEVNELRQALTDRFNRVKSQR